MKETTRAASEHRSTRSEPRFGPAAWKHSEALDVGEGPPSLPALASESYLAADLFRRPGRAEDDVRTLRLCYARSRLLDRYLRPDPRRTASRRAGAQYSAAGARRARNVSDFEPAAGVRGRDDFDGFAAHRAPDARSGARHGRLHSQQGDARHRHQRRFRRPSM